MQCKTLSKKKPKSAKKETWGGGGDTADPKIQPREVRDDLPRWKQAEASQKI